MGGAGQVAPVGHEVVGELDPVPAGGLGVLGAGEDLLPGAERPKPVAEAHKGPPFSVLARYPMARTSVPVMVMAIEQIHPPRTWTGATTSWLAGPGGWSELGGTGRETARRLGAWGVRLVYTDVVRLDAEAEQELGLDCLELEELLAAADIVSLHVPLTPETERMVNADRLELMKGSALLVNVARGEVVYTDALIAALRTGTIAGAALDVVDPEPLPVGHPLAELDNAVLTPHGAGTAIDARRRIMDLAGENIRRVMRGEPPVSVVNGVE